MEYELINPPKSTFNDPLRATEKAAADYFDWFKRSKNQRIKGLIDAVRSTSGFKEWSADFTPNSLVLLNKWFSRSIEMREMNIDEIQLMRNKIYSKYKSIKLSTSTPTMKTVSIAYDIGIYIGETFRHNHSNLRWKLFRKSKKFYDNNQPVLEGFGLTVFNPRIIERQLKKIKESDNHLFDLYKVWAGYI